jgi:hemoglobin
MTAPLPPRETGSTTEQEAAVEWMVRSFYARGLADAVLGPIFRSAIHDWEHHIRLVTDFWSNSLYGTGRYRGNAFAPHMKLRFEPEAFAHWLKAFEGAAEESLPPDDAAKAIRIARHMVQSYRAGLFPFVGADGRPSRNPAIPPKDPEPPPG